MNRNQRKNLIAFYFFHDADNRKDPAESFTFNERFFKMNMKRKVFFGTMLFLSYLLMFKISKIPTTLKNQKLEVILDLISNPNAETSLSSIQHGRDYFYDFLYCHRLECLQQKYRFWTQHKLTKTINTPEGKIACAIFLFS